MRRNHALGLSGGDRPKNRKARSAASCKTSSASLSVRVSQRARLYAAVRCGRSARSNSDDGDDNDPPPCRPPAPHDYSLSLPRESGEPPAELPGELLVPP